MLGFSYALCQTSKSVFGGAASEVPIWMSEIRCVGLEKSLDHCPFSGWGSEEHSCLSHSDDVGGKWYVEKI